MLIKLHDRLYVNASKVVEVSRGTDEAYVLMDSGDRHCVPRYDGKSVYETFDSIIAKINDGATHG